MFVVELVGSFAEALTSFFSRFIGGGSGEGSRNFGREVEIPDEQENQTPGHWTYCP